MIKKKKKAIDKNGACITSGLGKNCHMHYTGQESATHENPKSPHGDCLDHVCSAQNEILDTDKDVIC